MCRFPLTVAIVVGVTVPVVAQSDSEPRFEVVSIKSRQVDDSTPFRVAFEPGRFVTVNAPLTFWLNQVYPTPSLRWEGRPPWLGTNGFDINAKAEGEPSHEQMLGMLRSLLRDRFKLVVHYETREEDTFALIRDGAAPLGPQLRSIEVDCTARTRAQEEGQVLPSLPRASNGAPACQTVTTPGAVLSGGLTSAILANALAWGAGRTVVDQTGLSGHYEVTLKFFDGSPDQRPADAVDFFTAVREQLGLRLVAGKNPVKVLVIDHIELPAAD